MHQSKSDQGVRSTTYTWGTVISPVIFQSLVELWAPCSERLQEKLRICKTEGKLRKLYAWKEDWKKHKSGSFHVQILQQLT